jgi:hypothetical protein
MVVTHPNRRRYPHAAVDRAGPASQKISVPVGPQQHQLGRGIGGPEALDGGQTDQIVTDRVGPQHGQLPDPLDQIHAVTQ